MKLDILTHIDIFFHTDLFSFYDFEERLFKMLTNNEIIKILKKDFMNLDFIELSIENVCEFFFKHYLNKLKKSIEEEIQILIKSFPETLPSICPRIFTSKQIYDE